MWRNRVPGHLSIWRWQGHHVCCRHFVRADVALKNAILEVVWNCGSNTRMSYESPPKNLLEFTECFTLTSSYTTQYLGKWPISVSKIFYIPISSYYSTQTTTSILHINVSQAERTQSIHQNDAMLGCIASKYNNRYDSTHTKQHSAHTSTTSSHYKSMTEPIQKTKQWSKSDNPYFEKLGFWRWDCSRNGPQRGSSCSALNPINKNK